MYAYRAKLLEVTAFFDGIDGVDGVDGVDGIDGVDKTDLTDGETHPVDL